MKSKLSDIITLESILSCLKGTLNLEIDKQAEEQIEKCRAFLDKLSEGDYGSVYGVNTGFGSLCNVIIEEEQTSNLQKKLILSHSAGIGKALSPEIVRLMLFFKSRALAQGFSGCSKSTIDRLVFYQNKHLSPFVPEIGSLGASGDLAPLAHMSLPLIGEGEFFIKGEIHGAAEVHSQFELSELKLKSKEGLALLNGTQFMTANLAWCVTQGLELFKLADLIAALSLESWNARTDPFDPDLHAIRPHPGQIDSAANISLLREESNIAREKKEQVQDPYSFRCIPQVHGASRECLSHALEVLLREVNSVSDNPTVFVDKEKIISGGNFHGQILAFAADNLKLGIAEIGSISERRVFNLMLGKNGLPTFLTPMEHAGLNSGLMIPQYTAAALVSKNKQLCTPASIDNITSSNGQEDHVSMGANASRQLCEILENSYSVLAIELISAAQAFDFRKKASSLQSSSVLVEFHNAFREIVPFLNEDRIQSKDINASLDFLKGTRVKEWTSKLK